MRCLCLSGLLFFTFSCSVFGHIHPSICVTKKGAIVVVHYDENNARVNISRSADGGKSWSKSEPVAGIKPGGTYPGALTALSDGRIVVTWNWYPTGMKDPRFTQFAISSDEGKTWSTPREVKLDEPGTTRTGVRHALLELAPSQWVFPLAQQTVVFDEKSGNATPFADGKNHGMVPLVRTPKGTLISGNGRRSSDEGKTWQQIKPFPTMAYHTDMIALSNGLVVAALDSGADGGVGGRGTCISLVMSRDDGKTWDLKGGVEIYKTNLPTVPRRTRGGVGNPQLAQIDADNLGVVFFTHLELKHPETVLVANGERGTKVVFMRVAIKPLQSGGK